MNGVRTPIRLLRLPVPAAHRERFVEEWVGDLLSASSSGASRWQVLLGIVRVTLFVRLLQLRKTLRRGTREQVSAGVGGLVGLLAVTTDVPLDAMVPVLVLPAAWLSWRAVRAWIHAPR